MRAEKIKEIVSYAEKHNGVISYQVVLDIMKDKDDEITDKDILNAIAEIERYGIQIGQENEEDYPSDKMDEEEFIPADVNITPRTLNVYNLMERLENNEIDLLPDFQRHGDLWTLENQSRLIESLMLKIPIPAFYFNATNDSNWIVIDGLQRLSAFKNYLVGEPDDNGVRQKRRFQGFQYLKDFNDVTFDELPRQYIRRIKETSIIAYTVEKGTPDRIVYNIFQRINTGGMSLNSQEIRQALYQGKATVLIQKLAECEEFLSATQKAISPVRMADREYVTRYLAFTELNYREEYKGNIDDYLINALKTVNDYDDDKLKEIEKQFKNHMNWCNLIFGKYAFRKYNSEWHRGPINKAIFELWAICFHELSDEKLERIFSNKERLLKEFGQLLTNKEFAGYLKAGDQYSVMRRVDMAKNLLKGFL